MIKTEHNGAKNGGGYWGGRAWAKFVSARLRRKADKRESVDVEEPEQCAAEARLDRA